MIPGPSSCGRWSDLLGGCDGDDHDRAHQQEAHNPHPDDSDCRQNGDQVLMACTRIPLHRGHIRVDATAKSCRPKSANTMIIPADSATKAIRSLDETVVNEPKR